MFRNRNCRWIRFNRLTMSFLINEGLSYIKQLGVIVFSLKRWMIIPAVKLLIRETTLESDEHSGGQAVPSPRGQGCLFALQTWLLW